MYGYDGSPFIITDMVHKNAHYDAVEYLDSILEDLYKTALDRDGQMDSKWATE